MCGVNRPRPLVKSSVRFQVEQKNMRPKTPYRCLEKRLNEKIRASSEARDTWVQANTLKQSIFSRYT